MKGSQLPKPCRMLCLKMLPWSEARELLGAGLNDKGYDIGWLSNTAMQMATLSMLWRDPQRTPGVRVRLLLDRCD